MEDTVNVYDDNVECMTDSVRLEKIEKRIEDLHIKADKMLTLARKAVGEK